MKILNFKIIRYLLFYLIIKILIIKYIKINIYYYLINFLINLIVDRKRT